MEIIEFKVTEKSKKKAIFRAFGLNYLSTRSLNKVILDDSNRSNSIVQ